MPPVTKTLDFINVVIIKELLWLKAKLNSVKIFSIMIIYAAVMGVGIGLWNHNFIIIVLGFLLFILFNLLMNYIADKEFKNK
ncbi:MAG: hypothetical protein A2Y23_13840 [Clostridiales bacterium GWB2_37_7]|nr:MAG: hypothetical protein A2Y23_13840 [Clostridiales bacterium GWB2_37_7]